MRRRRKRRIILISLAAAVLFFAGRTAQVLADAETERWFQTETSAWPENEHSMETAAEPENSGKTADEPESRKDSSAGPAERETAADTVPETGMGRPGNGSADVGPKNGTENDTEQDRNRDPFSENRNRITQTESEIPETVPGKNGKEGADSAAGPEPSADMEEDPFLEEVGATEAEELSSASKAKRAPVGDEFDKIRISQKSGTQAGTFAGGLYGRCYSAHVYDGSGKKRVVTAFCIQPEKGDPRDTYSKKDARRLSNTSLLAVAMYYLPEDSPGYGTDEMIADCYKAAGADGSTNIYRFTHYILGAIYEKKSPSAYMSDQKAVNNAEKIIERLKKLSIPSAGLSSGQVEGRYTGGRYISSAVVYSGPSGSCANLLSVTPDSAFLIDSATGGKVTRMTAGRSYQVVSDRYPGTVSVSLDCTVPLNYSAYYIKTEGEDQNVGFTLCDGKGSLGFAAVFQPRTIPVSVMKTLSSRSSMSTAGAEFTLDDGNGHRYRIVTSEGGRSEPVYVLPGTYHVTETKAPAGCIVNASIPDIAVSEDLPDGTVFSFSVEDTPAYAGVRIRKRSAVQGDIPDGDANFAGATFGIRNVSGYSVTLRDEPSKAFGNGQDLGITLVTEKGGWAECGTLLQAGTYEIYERKAPEGYRIQEKPITFSIAAEHDGRILDLSEKQQIEEPVVLGGFRFRKTDEELEEGRCSAFRNEPAFFAADHGEGKKRSQGDAVLEGAEFDLINRSASSVTVDGKRTEPGDVITSVTASDLGGFIGWQSGSRYLPYGTYELAETKPPKGYNLRGKHLRQTFQIRKDAELVELAYPAEDDVIRFDIEIRKFRDTEDPDETGDDLIPVPGVVFDIYLVSASDEKPVLSITTDESGLATTRDSSYPHGRLPYGIYRVSERDGTNPPDLIPVKDFRIDGTESGGVYDGKTYSGIFKNDRPVGEWLMLRKTDATTGKTIPAAGVEFQILRGDGTPVSLRNSSPSHEILTSFVTDETGTVSLPQRLSYGSYTLHEVHAPDGYALGEDRIFHVTSRNSWENVITWTMEDPPVTGQVILSKQDRKNGSLLQGAVYEIYAAEDIVTGDGTLRAEKGDRVDCFRTGSGGTGRSGKLFLGRYELVEKTAPDGYRTSAKRIPFELKYEGETVPNVTVSIRAENEPTAFELSKYEWKVRKGEWSDEAPDRPLEGVTYEITRTGDFPEEGTVRRYAGGGLFHGGVFTTGKNGIIRIERIPTGIYSVRETATRPGYVKETETFSFTVDGDGKIYESDSCGRAVGSGGEKKEDACLRLIRKNRYTRWDFSKKDFSGEELPGAHMQVRDVNGEIAVYEDDSGIRRKAEWISDGTPHRIGRIPTGRYFLHEEVPAPGYTVASDIPFEVQETGEVRGVFMTDKKLTVRKVDTLGHDISGAVLALYEITEEGGLQKISEEPYLRWTTDGKPYEAEGLVTGHTYRLKEERIPEGYLGAEPVDFTVEDDGTDQTVVLTDRRVLISKTDAEFEALPGARLEVRDRSGALLDAWVSDGSAHAVKGLEEGETYTLSETEAPDGYVQAGPVRFTVSSETGDDEIRLINKQVLVTKAELTGNGEIPGACLEVTDRESGLTADSWVSDQKPHPVSGLQIGKTYVLTERKPADGYVTAESIVFTVQDNYTDETHVMFDDVTKVRFSKLDEDSGKELAGAVLEVCDEEGRRVETWKTDGKPHEIRKLPVGTYMLREKKAPKGYEKAEEIPFTVRDTGSLQRIVMKDREKPQQIRIEETDAGAVRTGDETQAGRYLFLAVLGLMTAAAAAGAGIMIRKRE